MNQEVSGYLNTAWSSTSAAIRGDAPTGSITGTTLSTYHQAVQTAYQAFNTAISTAAQTAISNKAALTGPPSRRPSAPCKRP